MFEVIVRLYRSTKEFAECPLSCRSLVHRGPMLAVDHHLPASHRFFSDPGRDRRVRDSRQLDLWHVSRQHDRAFRLNRLLLWQLFEPKRAPGGGAAERTPERVEQPPVTDE